MTRAWFAVVVTAVSACGGSGGSHSLGANGDPRYFAVANSGHEWAAVGGDESQAFVAFSPDGTSWTEQAIPFQGAFTGVAHGHGEWLATGHLRITNQVEYSSVDGETWTEVNETGTERPRVITYYGYFAGVGGGTISTSADGTAWNTALTTFGFGDPRIRYTGGRAVVYDHDSGEIYLTSGSSWIETGVLIQHVDGIAANDSGLFGFAEGPEIGPGYGFGLTFDGSSWAQVERPDDPSFRDIVGVSDMLVGTADNGIFRTSGMPADWSWEQTEDSTGWTAIGAADDTIVAVGDGIGVSTDGGDTWSLGLE
jgi:hypothetical protein